MYLNTLGDNKEAHKLTLIDVLLNSGTAVYCLLDIYFIVLDPTASRLLSKMFTIKKPKKKTRNCFLFDEENKRYFYMC